MNSLLLDIANLSGLRDRQAIDFGLVKLMLHTDLWHFSTARLVRAVGPPDNQRWLTLASLKRDQAEPECDHAWLDLSHLPALSDFSLRETAIMTESVASDGEGPLTTIFPIDTQASVCSLLEVTSPVPIPADTQVKIDSVLHLYENLQSLLDYGEKDMLTELLNRKTFDGAFWRAAQTQEAAVDPTQPERRASTSESNYWLAVIDIDHFKHVNDNYGHLIGDEVLLLLARHMRASFRFHDQLYRFGGEEFVVLMRCASHADASAALERFRAQIAGHDFPQVGHISISIGFTPLNDNDTPSGAFDRADKAVYFAKGNGRNQVCSYTTLVASGDLVAQADGVAEVDFF
jgi:diguanylate cyclase (GGDEF)-like protein